MRFDKEKANEKLHAYVSTRKKQMENFKHTFRQGKNRTNIFSELKKNKRKTSGKRNTFEFVHVCMRFEKEKNESKPSAKIAAR